jgi:hypothetical protein
MILSMLTHRVTSRGNNVTPVRWWKSLLTGGETWLWLLEICNRGWGNPFGS